MPKIILVNPPLSGEERYGELSDAGVYAPPLGLGYLASVLKNEGYDVSILDCEALRLRAGQALDRILEFQPDYVGITAVTMSIHSAAGLAAMVKQNNGRCRIILGGEHLSALPEETMSLFPQFDIGVIGEGEITLIELLKALREHNDLSTVKGIIYKGPGNALSKTPARPLIADLDTIPNPAWDLFPDLIKYYRPSVFWFKKLPSASIITARGCPGRCSFCSRGVWGNQRYREHSAGYVMEMIKVLFDKYGIRDFTIYDDTFGVNRKRLALLCELLIKSNLKLVWSCNFRVEMADPQMLRLMKRAGCWGIAYGIESCSQEVLDFVQKGIKLEVIARALKMTKEAGIISKGYVMVGTLPDTVKTLDETAKGVLKLDLDILTVNSFTPFPGSADYQKAEEYGSFVKDWRFINQHNIVFVPHALTRKQIEHYIRLITRNFYLRPRILWRYVIMSLNPRYTKILFMGLISFLKFTFVKQEKELPSL